MVDEEGAPWVKYINGNHGKGTWTFFGGHDPEDQQHQIGDPPTDLSLHPHSPGYRLILNNVLFPAAKKRERSEEHTSELQSRLHLVCRLLLEKKKTHIQRTLVI